MFLIHDIPFIFIRMQNLEEKNKKLEINSCSNNIALTETIWFLILLIQKNHVSRRKNALELSWIGV